MSYLLCFQLNPQMECGQTPQVHEVPTCSVPATTSTALLVGRIVTPTTVLQLMVVSAVGVHALLTEPTSPAAVEQACKTC